MDLSTLPKEQLIDKLDRAVIAERFAESEGWALVKEASKRLVEQAQRELRDINVFENPSRAAELQIIIKILENLLPGIMNALKSEGELAFLEARERRLEEVR